MKVGTDGVLLGALGGMPDMDGPGIQKERPGVLSGQCSILDIGTGTGLVALMLAQRSSAQVDAVEIVAEAASQAAENAAQSPWADRVKVIHADFRIFYRSCPKKYDLIVSNPPYFRDSLRPAAEEKALARHGSSEFYQELLKGSALLLQPSGKCCLILPTDAASQVEAMAEEVELHLQQRISIRSRPGKKIIRQLLTLGKNKVDAVREKEVVIYQREGQYTAAFASMAAPFYLNL